MSVTGFECTGALCSKEEKTIDPSFSLLPAPTNVLLPPFLSVSLLKAYVMFWRLGQLGQESSNRLIEGPRARNCDLRSLEWPGLPEGVQKLLGILRRQNRTDPKSALSLNGKAFSIGIGVDH